MLVKGNGSAAAWTQDGGAFALNVKIVRQPRGDHGWGYGWSIHVDGGLLAGSQEESDVIWGPVSNDRADALGALGTLLSFLGSEADRYRSTMGQREPDDGCYHFGPEVAEWAYLNSDELEMAALEVEDAIER